MTRCAICQNYCFQDGKLARLALGNCKEMPKWQYPNPIVERVCADFKQVPESDLEKRLQWGRGL
jgi:hypothetical protein